MHLGCQTSAQGNLIARQRNIEVGSQQVKPVPRETVFGGYRGEAVMVIAMDDPDELGLDKAMCEIEYYAPSSHTSPGTRRIVHLSAIEHRYGRSAPNS